LLSTLLFGACATPRYGARVETFGTQYAQSAGINRKVESVSDEEAERVQVYFGTMPQGFARQEGNLVVEPGFPYRILGRVSTTGIDGYNEPSRQSYCPAGKVLAWVFGIPTAMLLFFPFAAPCMYGNMSNRPEDIEVRKEALVKALQRATRAAAGNALVVDELGQTVVIDARSGLRLAQQEMTSAAGWAVDMGGAVTPPVVQPPPPMPQPAPPVRRAPSKAPVAEGSDD
jgi:hypothetical protein